MRTRHEVDFLPERVRQQRDRRGWLARQVYLLAACVVAMGVLTYMRHGRIAKAKGELAELTTRVGDHQRQAAIIPQLERQMADLLIKKRIDEELGSRTDCAAALAELCRVTPANVTLISLEMKGVVHRVRNKPAHASSQRPTVAPTKRRDPDAGSVPRVQLDLTGLAPTDVDVANFIGQLAASCLFEDVNMGYAKTVVFRGRAVREFRAVCHLVK